MLETPSRVWRRIEAIEDRDMPSLPSLPPFEDSVEADIALDEHLSNNLSPIHSSPMHSTPAASAHHTAASTIRPPSSASSTARFANSLVSRSSKSSLGMTSSRGISSNKSPHDSFNISVIPSLPNIDRRHYSDEDETDEEQSKESVLEVYLPPRDDFDDRDGEQDISLTEALQSVSRTSSPPFPVESFETTQKKSYDYSVSLNSEPKASPFDKYRNVALRRTAARIRTPSLTRTTSSQDSSPTHSTPKSGRSIVVSESNAESPISAISVPLPRSNTAPPTVAASVPNSNSVGIDGEQEISQHDTDIRSMDITDVHISPPQLDPDSDIERYQDQETPYRNRRNGQRAQPSPGALSSASSSPPSLAFTPTPVFPRPRARFNDPPANELLATADPQEITHDHQQHPTEDQSHEEPLTPNTRRRSFLLSVINSTTRPRLKFPTPHPRNHLNLATPSIAESSPGSGPSSTPRTNLQSAFAGVTPRPRAGAVRGPRASHPLAQTILPSPETSDSESASPSSGGQVPINQWVTPVPVKLSPYDGTGVGDRASFISTASSHDLTTHPRVNTSFDPAMGFGAGAPGQGVGRFNAGKLNNYLHGLNRRLQEENEVLMDRLMRLEEEKKAGPAVAAESTARRLSGGGGRRASTGGTALGDVEEDIGGEGWMEEKAELENMVDALKEEVAKCMREKEETKKALEEEREEREEDKERWRDRMAEVEQGVEVIIKELEEKAEVAERRTQEVEEIGAKHTRQLEKRLAEVEGELEVGVERAEKAERVLESGKELGGELRDANERVAKIMGDLRNANVQIKELEEEVMRSDSRIDDLEKDLRDDRDLVTGLEEELSSKEDELATKKEQIRQMEKAAQQVDEELHATKAYVAELEEGASAAIERIESLEDELASANGKIQMMTIAAEQARDRMEKLDQDTQKAEELTRQLEEALEEAEQKMLADEEALNDLNSKMSAIDRERQREASIIQDSSQNSFHDMGQTEADVEALESELDNANKEIARLTTLLGQSPARKAMGKAREAKIAMLEREKEDLLERNKALRMTVNEMSSPNKFINASGISPIHRQVLSMSFRAPRTPGTPLRDISWLNNTTDPSMSPFIAEITRLQRELDRANESIDDKLDKLEDAGLGVVGLTKKLEDARSKISALEDEIARLSRREERRLCRLERTRCQKCHTKVNFLGQDQPDGSSMETSIDDLPTEPPTPPTKTSEALRANLWSVNSHLETMKKEWEDERRNLVGEKAVLQDAANRLNMKVQTAKEETKKAAESEHAKEKLKAGIQGDLDKAKKVISDLEASLKAERSQLRALTTEQNRMQREKADVLTQLQRTESDMDDVRQQLQKYKQENHDLETELRQNANAEQKARLLEGRVAENMETIDQLRQERTLLAADHKELQRRFSDISEQANRLRDEYAASATSHDNRRHQLDLHLLEIDDLRRALSEQAEELQRAEVEKDRISAEKSDVAKTVAILQADLKRVKKDAEVFGRDLKLLRVEKEKQETKHKEELSRLDRTRKQAQTQIRLLNEQLENQRDKTNRAREDLKKHVCAADERQISALKIQHKKECKGLIVQIRYLKAKFTRESSLRGDLVYQKKYLLVLLSRFEKSEQTIFASIAQIGIPISPSPPAKKRRKLKSVALAVAFLSRAK
ncbi:hypothetical protein L208DRAFT_1243498 [Tricholoma matsutake]|nr:hypothetical protein L208DRAFT_1243498 [Tricholoma matsutake 945]